MPKHTQALQQFKTPVSLPAFLFLSSPLAPPRASAARRSRRAAAEPSGSDSGGVLASVSPGAVDHFVGFSVSEKSELSALNSGELSLHLETRWPE